MPPTKRKWLHDDEQAHAQSEQPGPTRRVTRQSSNPPPPPAVPPDPAGRRRSLRGRAAAGESVQQGRGREAGEEAGRRRGRTPNTTRVLRTRKQTEPAPKRRARQPRTAVEAGSSSEEDADEEDNASPVSTRVSLVVRAASTALVAAASMTNGAGVPLTDGVASSSGSKPPPPPKERASPKERAPAAAPLAKTSTMRPPPSPAPGRPDRNIDKVVLGKICFRAWYPSYYGKDVLGETATHHGKVHPPGSSSSSSHHGHSHGHGHGHGHTLGHHAARNPQPMLDRLYVCPCCFKYSKEIVPWWGHVQLCERQFQMPGEKVYVHPRSARPVCAPAEPKARRRRTADHEAPDDGEWSVWEVDGEKDVLFCQNLSLFAKLFLDNKSVFFDVTGFHYFLLVYTPPDAPTDTTDPARPRVVGFFSKEKMSWDNNNLACILVFPPWQRKGLGSLLMGVSYEISRREEVLGGPEKPISDLGKRGYRRYWAGEIARWLLGLDEHAPGVVCEEADSTGEKTLVVDTADCSRATYIARDDCLLVLREMGIIEDAGRGPPKGRVDEHGDVPAEAAAPVSLASPAAAAAPVVPAPPAADTHEVQRVRISKTAVRQWVARNHISLELTCDPAGFIKTYSRRDVQQLDR